jgi:hypothetical protein
VRSAGKSKRVREGEGVGEEESESERGVRGRGEGEGGRIKACHATAVPVETDERHSGDGAETSVCSTGDRTGRPPGVLSCSATPSTMTSADRIIMRVDHTW